MLIEDCCNYSTSSPRFCEVVSISGKLGDWRTSYLARSSDQRELRRKTEKPKHR